MRAFGVFAYVTNGIPMPSEVSPLAATGYQWYANVYQWLPMVFSIGSQACRQITNAQNYVIFKMTTNENDKQIGAEMKEMKNILSVSMGANTRFSKFQKRFLILPQLSKFHIYCILLNIYWVPELKYLYCKDIVDRNSRINLFS